MVAIISFLLRETKALETFGSSIGAKMMCEELSRLKREAALAQLEGKKIRKSRDLTFREDAELSREQHRKLDAVLKHQLIGHDGKPCPDGFPWASKPAPRVPQKSSSLEKRRKA